VHRRIVGHCNDEAAAFMNGSAATLSPTCFIATSTRFPAYDTPMASSSATFSLVDHRPLIGGSTVSA